MPRQLSPERQEELESLYRLLGVYAGFLRQELRPEHAALLEEGIEKAYRAKSLSGVRMGRDDMVAMTDALTAPQLRQLDGMLREQAGTSLDALQTRRLARIAKVRERGRIANDEQYYLVRERIEQIWDDPGRADELHALQSVLTAYEERRARTG